MIGLPKIEYVHIMKISELNKKENKLETSGAKKESVPSNSHIPIKILKNRF